MHKRNNFWDAALASRFMVYSADRRKGCSYRCHEIRDGFRLFLGISLKFSAFQKNEMKCKITREKEHLRENQRDLRL